MKQQDEIMIDKISGSSLFSVGKIGGLRPPSPLGFTAFVPKQGGVKLRA
jgi:hypothetical protein